LIGRRARTAGNGTSATDGHAGRACEEAERAGELARACSNRETSSTSRLARSLRGVDVRDEVVATLRARAARRRPARYLTEVGRVLARAAATADERG
jgi:hypothetical protein